MNQIDRVNTDRRVHRTQLRLKQSFINLLKSKAIDRITVTELCDSVDINRSTFYQYYCNIYDLLCDVERDFAIGADKLITEITAEENLSPNEVTMAVLKYIYQQKELLYLFIFKYKDFDYWEQINEKVLQLFRVKTLQSYTIPEGVSEAAFEDTLIFITAGFYSMYKRWLADGCSEAIESLAARTTTLSQVCINSILKPK